MKVCIGGTFDFLHPGHEALLKKAFEVGEEVFIGLSSDEFVRKSGKIARPYEERLKRLKKFLSQHGWGQKAKIIPLENAYGTATHDNYDAIVVSPETERRAREINEIRRKNGLNELKVIVVPYVLADDGIPIASSRIKSGEIDGRHRIRPLKVCIATGNEVKIKAVKQVFDELFDFEIEYIAIPYKGKKQPFGEEILKGAMERAKSCNDCDYCIGIEAGVVENNGIYFVEQYVVARDKINYMTFGKSPAFECPDWLLKELKKGKEMKEAIPFKKGEESKGAIWYFSRRMDRLELTKIGVFMAMIPRMRYFSQG